MMMRRGRCGRGLPVLAVLAASLGAVAASPTLPFAADDPIFGERGDGAAAFPRFDVDLPDVGSPFAKNCSACGGRDGCVGCICIKKCATPQTNESLPFLSRTLGSHMVLQRAPASAMVYGHAKQGATITTTFGGKNYTTTTDSVDVGVSGLGTWRQALPPTLGGKTAHTLSVASSAGDRASLEDVLFGEVYFCSGQSNMEDPMLTQINATEECERANGFPTIRLFTVNDDNPGRAFNHGGPEHDLQNVMQPWMQASNTSLCRRENATSYVTIPPRISPEWHGGDFSAMCWFFGRQISEGLSATGDVPVGLIASDWGGTALSQWTPADAVADCAITKNCTGKGWIGGDHYNAMVNPFTVGPMSLSGFAW
jgi:sialate O-acetylesterase